MVWRGMLATVVLAGCSFRGAVPQADGPQVGEDASTDGGGVDAPELDAPVQPVAGVPGGVVTQAIWWIAADRDVTTAGSAVTAWADGSAAGRDLAAASSGERPALIASSINFNPAIAFVNDRMVTSQPVFGAGVSHPALAVFVVLADDNASDFDWVLYEGTVGFDRFSVSRNFNGSAATDLDATTTNRVATSRPLTGSLVTAIYDTQGGPQVALYVDGGFAQSRGSYAPYGGTSAVMQVGDNDVAIDSANSPFDGRLAEVYVVSARLTAEERRRIESYLALKWGIPLAGDYIASSGVVVWPGSQVFDRGIAGIARDDGGNLAQRQARSADGRALVTIGAGTIAASNAQNTTPLVDLGYLVWGHDGGGLVWQTNERPPAVARRITREYRIVETGTVGTVRVRVPDASSIAPERLADEGPGGVVLLVDDDGNFSTGAQVFPMTLVGQSWEVDVDLSGTSYVTVGDS